MVAGLLVDELDLEAIASLAVDLVEPDALGLSGDRIERDRARDERELEIALSGRGRHGTTPTRWASAEEPHL